MANSIIMCKKDRVMHRRMRASYRVKKLGNNTAPPPRSATVAIVTLTGEHKFTEGLSPGTSISLVLAVTSPCLLSVMLYMHDKGQVSSQISSDSHKRRAFSTVGAASAGAKHCSSLTPLECARVQELLQEVMSPWAI